MRRDERRTHDRTRCAPRRHGAVRAQGPAAVENAVRDHPPSSAFASPRAPHHSGTNRSASTGARPRARPASARDAPASSSTSWCACGLTWADTLIGCRQRCAPRSGPPAQPRDTRDGARDDGTRRRRGPHRRSPLRSPRAVLAQRTVMLALIADPALSQDPCRRIARGGPIALVVRGRPRLVPRLPSASAKAAKEVRLLGVEEESLVKSPGVLQRGSAQQDAATRDPVRRGGSPCRRLGP